MQSVERECLELSGLSLSCLTWPSKEYLYIQQHCVVLVVRLYLIRYLYCLAASLQFFSANTILVHNNCSSLDVIIALIDVFVRNAAFCILLFSRIMFFFIHYSHCMTQFVGIIIKNEMQKKLVK